MNFRLAWQNISHRRLRALAAIAGVAFSILLVFMQLGIFSAAERSADLVFNALDFDIALVDENYVFLANGGTVPRSVLAKVRGIAGVSSVQPLHTTFTLYRNVEDHLKRGMLVMGVDPTAIPFADPEIQDQAHLLYRIDAALVDREARGEYGPRDVGLKTDLGASSIEIVGNYTLGTGFVASADTIVSEATFVRISPNRSVEQPTFGLIRVSEGQRVQEVMRRIRQRVPRDVAVRTRDEMMAIERHYFVNVKPIGIMFRSGVVVGFLVGAVTLYQILATQVSNEIRQLATMKAIGFADRSVYATVMSQGFIYAVAGYVPAFLGGIGLYFLLRKGASVPVWMTFDRAAMVFVLTLIMCVISSLLALRKVTTADPADLFG